MFGFIKNWFGSEDELNPNSVKRYYEQWHERYVESFGAVFQSAQMASHGELIQRIIGLCELKKDMKILDAGCGVGGPAMMLAESAGVIVEGITISPSQARHGALGIEKRGLEERVFIREGDFHLLSKYFPENQFDVIIFLESLVHSHDPKTVFNESDKVLKKGGILFIKDLFSKEGTEKKELSRIRTATENTNRYCRLKARPSSRIVEIAKNSGFELVLKNDLAGIANHDIGNAFILKNEIDIYEGEPLEYLEWAELKFIKK
jgi:cyclopropane fatty-acyl-phospholipid synthase-like methyltransferase